MDFAISEKMQTILGMVKEFIDKEVIPLEQEFFGKPLAEVDTISRRKKGDGQEDGTLGTNPPYGVRRNGPQPDG